jgi:hypothetical protein
MTTPDIETPIEALRTPIVPKEKPSRKAQQREARRLKTIEKAKRKLKVQQKTARKLNIKAERKKNNKRENSQQKLAKKIKAREEAGISSKPSLKGEKRVFLKPEYGVPQEK